MEDRELLVLDGPHDGEAEEDFTPNSFPTGDKTCLNLVYLAALVAAIGGLLFGYDVGIITGAKLQVAHDLELTCAQEELLVALMPLGALSASLVADPCLSGIGRKTTIQLTALIFTLGALLMAFSHSLLQLLIGRFTVGFAVSLSAMAECLYISEISAPSNRGLLISLNELGITVGLLLAYITNFIFMSVSGGWRYMFGLSTVLSVVQFGALLLLPSTPHFLVMKSRDSEACAVLERMGSGVGVRQQLANIRASRLEVEESSCSALFGSQNNMRGRLFIGLGLVLLQQITGQPNILYYATDVFEAVGFCGSTLASLATVGLGLVKVGATVVSLSCHSWVGLGQGGRHSCFPLPSRQVGQTDSFDGRRYADGRLSRCSDGLCWLPSPCGWWSPAQGDVCSLQHLLDPQQSFSGPLKHHHRIRHHHV